MRRRIRTRHELPGPREAEDTPWSAPKAPVDHLTTSREELIARGVWRSNQSDYGWHERREQNLNLRPSASFDMAETFSGWIFKLLGWTVIIIFIGIWVIDNARS